MFRKPDRQSIAWALAALSISILFLSLPATASATPAGSSFDHIIIIAMENQNYPDVLGDGTQPDVQQGPRPSSAAYSSSARPSPAITAMAPPLRLPPARRHVTSP